MPNRTSRPVVEGGGRLGDAGSCPKSHAWPAAARSVGLSFFQDGREMGLVTAYVRSELAIPARALKRWRDHPAVIASLTLEPPKLPLDLRSRQLPPLKRAGIPTRPLRWGDYMRVHYHRVLHNNNTSSWSFMPSSRQNPLLSKYNHDRGNQQQRPAFGEPR